MEIFYLIFFILIIAFIFSRKIFNKPKQSDQLEKIYDKVLEIKNYIDQIKKNKKIPIIKTSIMLKNNEEAYLEDNVKLYEIRSARKSDRLFAGGRIMKGIYLGGSTGVSRSFDELREIDSGKLVLTNQRIVFDGSFNSRVIDLNKIISLELYDDGIEIATEGKEKSQLYGGIRNPFLWKNLTTGIVKTAGRDNNVLDENDMQEMEKAVNELDQFENELRQKLGKS